MKIYFKKGISSFLVFVMMVSLFVGLPQTTYASTNYAWTDITNGESFGSPYGIAVDSTGSAYMVDYRNNTIYQLSGGSWTDIKGSATLSGPSGVAVDSSGSAYVVDLGDNEVWKRSSGGVWTNITGGLSTFDSPSGIAVDGSGNVYVSDTGHNKVMKSADGGTTWTNATGTGSFTDLRGIAADSSGNVYVTDASTNKVWKLTDGTWTDITATGGFGSPLGIAVDRSGNVFVADSDTSKIKELPVGGSWTVINGSQTFMFPIGIVVDSYGNVYVTDSDAKKVYKGAIPPTTATAASNNVSVSPSSTAAGCTVTITAAGNRQGTVSGSVYGDERYIPTTWSSDEPCSGSFTLGGGIYTSPYTTSAVGSYTITATFMKQIWDGAQWVDSGITDTKTTTLTVSSLPVFASGAGTSGDPWIITNVLQLSKVRYYLGNQYYFKLGNDIDMNTDVSTSVYQSGAGWVPIGDASGNPFQGHFDGGYHSISNLMINQPGTTNAGLFGYAECGSISNLQLKDVNITGNGNVGSLVGYNACTYTPYVPNVVTNCGTTGVVIGNSDNVGGLVGFNSGVTTGSYAACTVIGTGSAVNIGGLVGVNVGDGSYINNCYAVGRVTGANYVGGLLGYNGPGEGSAGLVQYSYAVGATTTTTTSASGVHIGGLVGKNDGVAADITDSHYDKYTTRISESATGLGVSTSILKKEDTATTNTLSSEGWDFSTIWKIDSGLSYPYFQWQTSGRTDYAPPVYIMAPNGSTTTTVSFNVAADESCTAYYVVLPTGADSPSPEQIRAGQNASGTTLAANLKGSISMVGTAPVTGSATVISLQPSTTYDIYMVNEDILGNFQPREFGASMTTKINVTTAPGNGHVGLSWDPVGGAEYYEILQDSVSLGTVTGSVYDATGLTNGTTYNFEIRAYDDGDALITSGQISAAPQAPQAPSGGGGGGGAPAPADSGVEVLVNGKAENAGTATDGTRGSQTVTNITVDEKKLEQKMQSEGDNAVITVPVNTKSDILVGELNGQMVKDMETKQDTLEIRTEKASYFLPAQQINIDSVSAQVGQSVNLKDIKIHVEIAKSTTDTVKVVEDSAQKGNFTVMLPPMDFTVKGSYGGKTVDVSKFNVYVKRVITIPDGVDPSKITTGVITEPDGTSRHVPTGVTQINGKYYATINSLTNSTYAVVWHPLEFTDVANHWAKADVNDMGSRMVVSGVGNGLYEPDRDITRAEFAAIVVRALGLKTGEGSNQFTDVASSEWYCDYIKTATSYNIIKGYGDGKFGPMDKITREQAMAMIAKAMNITALKAGLSDGETDKLLAGFNDGSNASDYAKASIAACVKTGVVSGRGNNIVAPKDNITRAEVAAIVKRLLKKSNLI